MPTINILSARLESKDKKKIALMITRELKSQGVEPSHCMVIFTSLAESSVFSGGVLLHENNRETGRANLFFLRVSIAVNRDKEFREQLAKRLFILFSALYEQMFFYFQYEDVIQSNVFYSQENELIQAASKGK